MTKYVNQDVFDASLLLAAADYLDSGSELQLHSTVGQLVQYYQNDYVGDYLFRNQLIEMAPKLVKKFEKNYSPSHANRYTFQEGCVVAF